MSLPRIWQELRSFRDTLSQYFFLTRAISPLTIYVRTTGSPSGTGLSESAAVQTFEQAKNIANSYMSVNVDVTINIGAGIFYLHDIYGSPIQGGITTGKLIITGQGAGSTNIANAITIGGGARVHFVNVNFNGTIYVQDNSTVYFQDCKWTSTGNAIECGTGGVVSIMGSASFEGWFGYGFVVHGGGLISIKSIPIYFDSSNPPAFPNGFLCAGRPEWGPGTIAFDGSPSFNGAVGPSSKKYSIFTGGTIQGRTRDQLNALPGDIAGSVSSGGVAYSGQFISSGNANATGYLLANGQDLVTIVGQGGASNVNGDRNYRGYLLNAEIRKSGSDLILTRWYSGYTYSDYGDDGGE